MKPPTDADLAKWSHAINSTFQWSPRQAEVVRSLIAEVRRLRRVVKNQPTGGREMELWP